MVDDEGSSEFSRISKVAGELRTLLKTEAATLGYQYSTEVVYIGQPRWIRLSFYPTRYPPRSKMQIAHPTTIDALVETVALGTERAHEYKGFKVEVVHAEADIFESLGYEII